MNRPIVGMRPSASGLADPVGAEIEIGVDELRPFDGMLSRSTEPACPDGPELELELSTLSPLQRVWITTDGMVTQLLEAYHLEPIEVLGLGQHRRVLAEATDWLDTPARTSVIMRQVLLRGRKTGTIYLHATSLLVPERLPPPVHAGLSRGGSGLGRLLAQHDIESRREILTRSRRGTAALPGLPGRIRELFGDEVLSRTYRIITGSRPMMLINENVPVEPRPWA